MILYLVRHGMPDYATDTLLPEGWEQARLVAERLADKNIDEIHSSPMGRARQTAQPLAEKLGKEVIVEDWAYELGEEAKTTFPDGVPKVIARTPIVHLLKPEYRKMDSNEAIDNIEAMLGTHYAERYRQLSEGVDGMLEKLGYRRNANDFYDVIEHNERHVVLFCHMGMMRILMSHLLNIPVQYLAATLMGFFTGVTTVYLGNGDDSKYITGNDHLQILPELLTFADIGHLHAAKADVVHANKPFVKY